MQMISRTLPALLVALMFPLSAAAGQRYLGGSLGQATTDVDDGTITARLADEGLTGR